MQNVTAEVNFVYAATTGPLLSTIALLVASGSVLVIAAISTTKRLQTVTNLFVVSLATADLLVAILVLPLGIATTVLGHWPFGTWVCEVWRSLDILLCTASILNLCAISLDRYFAITQPLIYATRRSKKLASFMIIGVWTLSSVITFPPLLGWTDRATDEHKCEISLHRGYRVYSAMGSFFVPFVIMLFVYCRIFAVARRRRRLFLQMNQTACHHSSTFPRGSCVPSSGPEEVSLTLPGPSERLRLPPHRFPMAIRLAGPRRSRAASHCGSELPSEDDGSDSAGAARAIRCPARPTHLQRLLFDSGALERLTSLSTQCFQLPQLSVTNVRSDCGQKVKRQLRLLPNGQPDGKSRKKERAAFNREHKTAKTLAIVIGCFSACWLPFFTIYLTEPFCDCSFNFHLLGFVTWLGYVNSVFNPFIYALYNKEFALAFRRLLTWKRGTCCG